MNLSEPLLSPLGEEDTDSMEHLMEITVGIDLTVQRPTLRKSWPMFLPEHELWALPLLENRDEKGGGGG